MSLAKIPCSFPQAVTDYRNSDVITFIDSTTAPLEEVPFPGLTVCNINNIKQSEFHEIGISHNESAIDVFFKFYVRVRIVHFRGGG